MTYYLYKALSKLPLSALYGLSYVLYLLIYRVFKYRTKTVRQNLERAFPDKNADWIANTERAFYRQFVDVTLEILKAHSWQLGDVTKHMSLANEEVMQQYTQNGTRSVVLLTMHRGNWEWMLHFVNAALGLQIDPVYKPLTDKGADRFAYETRARFGSRPIPMANAARDMIKHRRQFRLFTMVADQSPGARDRGYWTTFLNQDTGFFTGGAALARATGFPVLFARCDRTAQGQYTIHLHPITEDPKSMTEAEIVARYVALCEQAIRDEPDNWLWSNRRWKHTRPADNDQPNSD